MLVINYETVVAQRRAIRASRALPAGTKISAEDLTVLRPCPEDALPPYKINDLIGRTTAREIESGDRCVRETDVTKIGIVIPALNEAKTVGGVIALVIEIGHVIVVDDGSTDGTRKWLRRRVRRLSGIRKQRLRRRACKWLCAGHRTRL